jgi:hypothetical protein
MLGVDQDSFEMNKVISPPKDLWKGWLRIDHLILLAKFFNNIVGLEIRVIA